MTPEARNPIVIIDRDLEAGWLSAMAAGTVVDAMTDARTRQVGAHAAWMLDESGDQPIGFAVRDTAGFDPDDNNYAEFWDPAGPRFEAPALALASALAGEIIVAALARYSTESTLNRAFFIQALGADDPQALRLWHLCLECGDLSAHYGLGYTYYELGHFAEAYAHLKYYATLVPDEPWVSTWLGRAALAIGEHAEAIRAWRHAAGLDEDGETDAAELLAAQLG